MAVIVLAGVTRHFSGTSRPAVDHLDLRVGSDVDLIARVDPKHPPAKGDRLSLDVDESDIHLFSVLTGDRLTAAGSASAPRVAQNP